jgi:hypothetical protein
MSTGKWLAQRRLARRGVPVMWALAVAEAVVATRRHWNSIDLRTRNRLRELVKKSRGRPSNLTREEKRELTSLVGSLNLLRLGRDLAAVASPVPLPGGRRRARKRPARYE